MNDTIKLLQAHRSIRKYKSDPIPQEYVDEILASAQMASSSSHVQAYSVIGVTDQKKKKELSILSGNQVYIEECPLFFVWCADLYRLKVACGMENTEMVTGTMENFIVATADVTLAAQNAAIAAESLGLGIVYIGGIRNQSKEVTDLLQLPELVYPVFGMCVGFPDQSPSKRPRLQTDLVYHHDVYNINNTTNGLKKYNEITNEYYLERTKGKVNTDWAKQMSKKFQTASRKHLRKFLEDQGFGFKE
ncbi:oxygen-insensitive NADPH nitroreductase [Chengkuizengella axinellae]|uniref:Oxygen-insensitive NADPH nitroreductase n=1 Tax=Chengkuizengella axinellae TaxID=3064388 RepID=A0ABT9J5W9_9BACL|nr:oxygen-insensitive NADPH nitroreductase [Chengkuizengella sp. 2205SS18-9]MDP5277015.1 oxygen-insensitive NADPH nitroreductase [Chengkuizengella sp. 2205SS18-9]